ncbi:MAG: aminotransferase class V-fold PLP-dependent enzyme [Kiritimatiellae bacterium]|nr:aminotransferase class V-fold PLP-dependent enzyme [Kiritimatiellia bacterium]
MRQQQKRIFLSPPWTDRTERDAVKDAFDSAYIAPCGPLVDEFERQIENFTSLHAAAVSSGTGAIDLLMMEMGIKPGDTVVASTLTFIASVGPAVHRGARVVFVDSASDTGTMSPSLLEAALQKYRPKCVICADIYGQTCDYPAIEDVCRAHGVPLVVDAAESFGATCKGRAAGAAGVAAVYSFNGNKIITTSGGGAVVSHDEALVERARKRSQQSRERVPHYEHLEVGSNYRLSNILAGIGVAQISKMRRVLKAKRNNYAFYRTLVNANKGLLAGAEFFPCAAPEESSHWLNVVLLPDSARRDAVMAALAAADIESRPVWKPLHRQSVFKGCETFGGAVADDLFARGVCLPSGCGLDDAAYERIAEAMK